MLLSVVKGLYSSSNHAIWLLALTLQCHVSQQVYQLRTLHLRTLARLQAVYSWPAAAHPVYDPGTVEVFDATQHLIEQVRQPLMVQLHLNHLTQVGIHQLHYQVSDRKEKGSWSRQRVILATGTARSDSRNCTGYFYLLTHLGNLLAIFVAWIHLIGQWSVNRNQEK